ncbi:hypothetical protein [Cytobacillus horneckiae]
MAKLNKFISQMIDCTTQPSLLRVEHILFKQSSYPLDVLNN